MDISESYRDLPTLKRWYDFVYKVVDDQNSTQPDIFISNSQTQIDKAISKARTVLEIAGEYTNVSARVLLKLWLAILTPHWQEAQALKFVACQEYLMYRCRGGQVSRPVQHWLERVCWKIKRATPHGALSPFSAQIEEEQYKSLADHVQVDHLEDLINFPHILLNNEPLMSAFAQQCSPRTECGTAYENRDLTLLEHETVHYLQELTQKGAVLAKIQHDLAKRISKDKANLERYRTKIRHVIEPLLDTAEANPMNSDARIILDILELARKNVDENVENWRRIDDERKTVMVTVARLEKLLDTKLKAYKGFDKNRDFKKLAAKGSWWGR